MLPGLDGLALLESLRREQATPVMLMSALGAEQDRISGFTRGADDYLPKPFSLAELDARTDALLRRVRLDRLPSAQRRDTRLVFDDQAQDVLHQGLPAGLTPSEYRLLATLREHAGEALSKPFLYRSVLHRYTRLDRGLDVHVCNLRRKLAAVAVRHLQIQAVRGQGYLLVETEHLMRRHPLLWKLALLQVGFCLLLTWLIYTWGLSVERSTYFLAPADRTTWRTTRGRRRMPGAARCRGRRTLPQGTVGEGRYLGGAGRTAPGKPRQHAAKRRGVEPPDLHAQARLADEPAPAGRTAVRQHRVPPTSRAGPAGNPVTGAPAARRADPGPTWSPTA